MTTLANVARPARVTDVGWIDWLLSVLVGAMAIATVTAVVLGRDEWHLVPAMVWGDKDLPRGTPASADGWKQRLLALLLLVVSWAFAGWVWSRGG